MVEKLYLSGTQISAHRLIMLACWPLSHCLPHYHHVCSHHQTLNYLCGPSQISEFGEYSRKKMSDNIILYRFCMILSRNIKVIINRNLKVQVLLAAPLPHIIQEQVRLSQTFFIFWKRRKKGHESLYSWDNHIFNFLQHEKPGAILSSLGTHLRPVLLAHRVDLRC